MIGMLLLLSPRHEPHSFLAGCGQRVLAACAFGIVLQFEALRQTIDASWDTHECGAGARHGLEAYQKNCEEATSYLGPQDETAAMCRVTLQSLFDSVRSLSAGRADARGSELRDTSSHSPE